MFEKQKNKILKEKNRRLSEVIKKQEEELNRYHEVEAALNRARDVYAQNAAELKKLKAEYLSVISDLKVLRSALPDIKHGGE